jgi:hypothetical protein
MAVRLASARGFIVTVRRDTHCIHVRAAAATEGFELDEKPMESRWVRARLAVAVLPRGRLALSWMADRLRGVVMFERYFASPTVRSRPMAGRERTPQDVAAWMLERIESSGFLDQEVAIYAIHEEFGDEFVYVNDSGNPAVSRPVLRAFRRLTEDTVVWQWASRRWKLRDHDDAPGRSQHG